MPHHKHARNIARLNFHEDRILFPDEAPQDIIGFCIGVKYVKGKPHFSITCRRVGINPEYTDIRREVGNLLLRMWEHRSMSMEDFWINKPRKDLAAREIHPSYRYDPGFEDKTDDSEFYIKSEACAASKDYEATFERLLAEHENSPSSHKQTTFINNTINEHKLLLDVVRPTLFIYTIDSDDFRFVDECIAPKEPSKRLDPYCRNLRTWFGRRALGWYSHFDADVQHNGGEFWYNLIIDKLKHKGLDDQMGLRSRSGRHSVDPGNGMGGGESFP